MKIAIHNLFGPTRLIGLDRFLAHRLDDVAAWMKAAWTGKLKSARRTFSAGILAVSVCSWGNGFTADSAQAQEYAFQSHLPHSHFVGSEATLYTPTGFTPMGGSTVYKQSVLRTIARGKELLGKREMPNAMDAASKVVEDWKALKTYLSQTADEANRQAWLEYTGVEPLIEHLEANREAEKLRVRRVAITASKYAKNAYWRLTSNQEGIERQPMIRLRESLQQLVIALPYFVSDKDRVELVKSKELDDLAAQISAAERPLTPDQLAKINELLNELNESCMVPEVVQQVTSWIGQPNVHVSIGQKAVQQIVSRPVSDSGPNSDCILGTRVLSQTNLNGQLVSQLVPNATAAQIQLVINANFNSRGTGYNSGVKIFNRSSGPVRSVRDLFITADGLSVGDVQSSADLETEILGIQHPWKLVRRIAAKRAAQQKSAANAIAESKLENRLSNQFAQQTSQQLSSGNLIPKNAAADVLTRLDLDQPGKHWSTSHDYVLLQLNVRNKGQITTLTPPPPVVPGFDLVLQIHETSILNHTDALLAGRKLSSDQFRSFVVNLLPKDFDAGGLPLAELLSNNPDKADEVEAGAEAIDEVAGEILGADLGLEETTKDRLAKLEIHFQQTRPLVLEARDGVIRVGMNVQSISRDEETLDEQTAIGATYKPVRNSDGSVSLQRTGDVSILVKSAEAGNLNVKQKVIIARLQGPLGNVFPDTLIKGPLAESVPAVKRFSPDPLTVKAIKPAEGWITIYAE